MSTRGKFIAAGAIAGVVVWWLLSSFWFGLLVFLGVLAVPVAGYFMLDSSQRQRVKRISRKRLGS